MKNQIFSNPNHDLLKEKILRLQAETKLINAEMVALKKDHKIDLNVQNMEINDVNEKITELLREFNRFRVSSIVIKKDDEIFHDHCQYFINYFEPLNTLILW